MTSIAKLAKLESTLNQATKLLNSPDGRSLPNMSGNVQFIIDHMNKDHLVSLYDFENAFKGENLDYFDHKLTQLRLQNITEEEMTLEWHQYGVNRRNYIPFEPPLKNLGEARSRIIDMAFIAAKKLGVSASQIKTYEPPQNLREASVLMGVGLFWYSCFYKEVVYSERVAPWIPLVSVLIALTHVAEIFFVLNPQLKYYRVPWKGRLEWRLEMIVGGFGTLRRFRGFANPLDKHATEYNKPKPVEQESKNK